MKDEYDYSSYADLLSDVTCQDVKVMKKRKKDLHSDHGKQKQITMTDYKVCGLRTGYGLHRLQ